MEIGCTPDILQDVCAGQEGRWQDCTGALSRKSQTTPKHCYKCVSMYIHIPWQVWALSDNGSQEQLLKFCLEDCLNTAFFYGNSACPETLYAPKCQASAVYGSFRKQGDPKIRQSPPSKVPLILGKPPYPSVKGNCT